MSKINRVFSIYGLLWLVYILFLGVLMPHTAWTFGQFQQNKSEYNPLAWMLAFAVESVIAVFTHKLAEYLSSQRKKKGFTALLEKWVNGYSIGLVMVLIISSIANLAYAVQFAGSLVVFTDWGIPVQVYEFTFGAMLPFVSLVFALVLSKMADDEQEVDPILDEAKKALSEVRSQLRESERGRKLAEERFGTVTDIAKMFVGENKRERIIAMYQRWPSLPHTAIAQMTEASPAHVSEVLKEFSKN
jgi:hypothetical protein